jgi:hypothetical protein
MALKAPNTPKPNKIKHIPERSLRTPLMIRLNVNELNFCKPCSPPQGIGMTIAKKSSNPNRMAKLGGEILRKWVMGPLIKKINKKMVKATIEVSKRRCLSRFFTKS